MWSRAAFGDERGEVGGGMLAGGWLDSGGLRR